MGTTDSTALIRALAAADLPRENAIYRAHLDNARKVTTGINATRWQVLDRLATVTDGENAAAAETLLGELRSAARHDEHEVGLAETLQQVEQRATALFLDAMSKREPQPDGKDDHEQKPEPGSAVQIRRARGAKVLDVVEEICAAADTSPDVEFEITWQVVPAVRTTAQSPVTNGAVPAANRTVVAAELRRAVERQDRRRDTRNLPSEPSRVLLLRATPEWLDEPSLTVWGLAGHDGTVTASVAGCQTVLAVLDALASRPEDGYLSSSPPATTTSSAIRCSHR